MGRSQRISGSRRKLTSPVQVYGGLLSALKQLVLGVLQQCIIPLLNGPTHHAPLLSNNYLTSYSTVNQNSYVRVR